MSTQVMMPTDPGADLLGRLSDDMDQTTGLGGSTPGQSSALCSALIEAMVDAFEEIMALNSGGSQGGAAFDPQSSVNASPFGDGSDDSGTDGPLDGGSGSEFGAGSTLGDLLNDGPEAASNLSSELIRLLSNIYNPGSDGSPSLIAGDSQDGSGDGSSFDQGAPLSGADQMAQSPSAPTAAQSGNDPTSTGQAKSIDGATPGDDTVDFKLVNTSNHDEIIALTNAQGQKFDEEHLKAGQSADVLLSANDPNTKSMREELENPDGSLQDNNAKIGESNIQDQNGHAVVSNDISNNNFVGDYGTNGTSVDGTQMTFSDNKGVTTGDGTANPAYQYSKDDPSAMNMAMDTARNYTLAIND